MKKPIKALAIMLSITALLTACGGSENATVSDKDIDLSSYPVQTDETLTYWRSLPINISTSVDNFGATEIAQEFERRTGIKIKYQHPAAGQETEALNLMISSNELPDIINTHWGQYPGGPTRAIDEEVIVPLDEYKEYAPGFFGFLEAHPEYDKAAKTDAGDHYAFVSIQDGNDLLVVSGPAVRKDWLDELGIEEPKSVDDWTNMLTAFKEKKGAEAPMSFNYGNICYFFNMFEARFDPYVDGDKVVYAAIQPEFKNALTVIRDWFEKGLLDKNIVSVDSKLIDNQILNDKTGATITSGGGGIGQYMKMGVQKNPNFNLSAVPFPSFSGEPTGSVPIAKNITGVGAAITTQAKNPALAAKALDYFYTEEGDILANFGVEGVGHTIVDGEPVYTDLIMNNPDGLTISQALGLNMLAGNGGAFVLDSRYIQQYYSLPQQKAALKNWTVGFEKSEPERVPMLTFTTEENSEYAQIMTEVDKYRDQMIVKFINGIEPIENFDKYVDTMKQLGVDRAMEIQTAALARYANR